jgi:hypothetical protein
MVAPCPSLDHFSVESFTVFHLSNKLSEIDWELCGFDDGLFLGEISCQSPTKTKDYFCRSTGRTAATDSPGIPLTMVPQVRGMERRFWIRQFETL